MRERRRSPSLAIGAAAAVLWSALLAALASTAAAEEAAPGARETVVAANERISKLVARAAPEGSAAAKARDAELDRVVSELLDLRQMAEDALGREWQKRSAPEREEYSRLLEQLVRRSYLRQARSRAEYSVEVGAASPERSGRVEVPTLVRVTRRGRLEEIEVVYTLARRDGRFRVVDVETDGVSTVRNYRSQFRRIVEQDGFPALLARMRSRLEAGEVDL